MITDVFDLRRTAESGFFPICQYFLEQMPVLGFLRRGVNQAWICRRVLWLELFDRFKIGCVSHDFGKLLQLLQLLQFCSGLLLLNDSSAHDNFSLFDLILKRTPEQKNDNDKLDAFAQLWPTFFAAT